MQACDIFRKLSEFEKTAKSQSLLLYSITSCMLHVLHKMSYDRRRKAYRWATLKPGNRKLESGAGNRNPEFGIRNSESGIRNPESGIRNPQIKEIILHSFCR